MEQLSFGQWLSWRRKSLGMTQKQLADHVNCATITIRKLEAEQRRPSIQVAERLAKTFNVPHEEKEAFFQYARGYKPLSSLFELHTVPWHPASGPLQPNMITSLLSHMEHEHALSEITGVYMDHNIHLVNQVAASSENSDSSLLDITHEATMRSENSQYYLLLVPIKVPSENPQVTERELTRRDMAKKSLPRRE